MVPILYPTIFVQVLLPNPLWCGKIEIECSGLNRLCFPAGVGSDLGEDLHVARVGMNPGVSSFAENGDLTRTETVDQKEIRSIGKIPIST